MIHRMSTPVRVDLVLNQDCNHKCVHCYNPWRDQCNSMIDYSDELIKSNIDKIVNELEKAQVWSAILTGGEPLLHSDSLFYCIEKLQTLGVSMSINTNLTLITEKFIDRLINQYAWNNIILTSLPSLDEQICDEITQVKGSYKRILAGIDLCVKRGIRVGINTVITRKNIADLVNYTSFIKEHSISYVSISTVIPPLYDVENANYYLGDEDIILIADTLLNIKNETNTEIGSVTPLPLCILKDADKYMPVLDTTCLAGVSKCSIDVTSGMVYACAHQEEGYGNVFTDGLEACWRNMNEWSLIEHLTKECQECKWLFICGGECRMMKCGNRKAPIYNLDRKASISFGKKRYIKQKEWPTMEESLQINPSFKYRKESFGYVVRCGYTETMISKSLFHLCEILRQTSFFTLKDIVAMLEDFEKAKPVINTLIQREIIVREKNE